MPRRRSRLRVLPAGIFLIAAAVACTAAPSAPSQSAGASAGATARNDRVVGWRSDLALLVPGMARLHPDLDHGTPVADLDAAISELSDRVPGATDDELLVGILRIVAMVSAHGCDAHTGAYVWGSGTYPLHSLPLRLWWFPDGLYVVDARDPYRDLIGSRLDTIAGRPARAVLDAISPLIPRDNDATVRLLMPRFVLIPEILRGLGLAGPGSVDLGSTDASGQGHDTLIDPIEMSEYNGWAGAYGLHLPADPRALYLTRIGDALWWQVLPDGQTLYVQQNRIERAQTSVLDALRLAMAAAGLRRVVVDLRHNFGGEVSGVDPFLAVFRGTRFDRPGGLFVVTGRNTFSAASLLVARFRAQTAAAIVGEAMGGCPTAYGNARELTLPFSGIVVDVATLLEVGVDAGDQRATIPPDLPAPLDIGAWRSGTDPALLAIASSR
jgi:hypothetical protein